MTSGERPVVLDEIDARPGSTTSLLRTMIGLYLRRLDEGIASGDLVRLLGDLGVPAGPARTAITRVKQKGLLRSRPGGYALAPDAIPMLERGDRRIFEIRRMQPGDRWCLVSATVPESRRDLRHQLRRRLPFLGAGSVSAALWIAPGYLDAEIEQLLAELGARRYATLFRTDDPRPPVPLADAVASWWDLAALRAEHLRFQDSVADLDRSAPFAAYVRLIDSWRVLPYVDPGLPDGLLPSDWPGDASFRAFEELSTRFAPAAWAHVRSIAG